MPTNLAYDDIGWIWVTWKGPQLSPGLISMAESAKGYFRWCSCLNIWLPYAVSFSAMTLGSAG